MDGCQSSVDYASCFHPLFGMNKILRKSEWDTNISSDALLHNKQNKQRTNYSMHIAFSRNVYKSLLRAGKHQGLSSAATIQGGRPSPKNNTHHVFFYARSLWRNAERSVACAQRRSAEKPRSGESSLSVGTWPKPYSDTEQRTRPPERY
jgi:hypothetical protein